MTRDEIQPDGRSRYLYAVNDQTLVVLSVRVKKSLSGRTRASCRASACHYLCAGRRNRSIFPMRPAPMAFLTPEKSRLLQHPGIGFSRVPISTLRAVCASLRPAWSLVLLDRSRAGETSLSGRRGLSTRAFPRKGHPPRESGITTRHPGAPSPHRGPARPGGAGREGGQAPRQGVARQAGARPGRARRIEGGVEKAWGELKTALDSAITKFREPS